MTEVTEKDLDNLRKAMAEDKKEPEATLSTVNELAEKLAALRDHKQELEEKVSLVSKEIEATNQRIIDILMENNLKSYRAPVGTLSVKGIFTAKLPQGEDKVTCFNYLKEIGRFEDMASIHSATFNSWVKEAYDLAQEKGEDEPQLPGVKDVKTIFRVSFLRSK